MNKQEIKDKIEDAHATADRLLTQEELRTKWSKVHGYMNVDCAVMTRWHVLGFCSLLTLAVWSPFSDSGDRHTVGRGTFLDPPIERNSTITLTGSLVVNEGLVS